MRTTILLAGLAFTLAACSDASPDRAGSDEERVKPDLALTRSSDGVAVVSDIEIHTPAVEPEAPEPVAVRSSAPDAEAAAEVPVEIEVPDAVASAEATVAAAEDAGVYDDHAAHADAGPEAASSGPVEGGGKPTGITEGRGRVPDRDWSESVIFDDPGIATGPLAGIPVIIRGGPGSIDDDCAIHPRGMPGGMMTPGVGDALVNDRTGGRTRGVSINERAPRSRPGGSISRGSGFPSRGIR